MNTILTQKGESNLGKILEDIKEKIEIKIDPNDFVTILECIVDLEEKLIFYKNKNEILESKFNNHTHVDGTIAIKQDSNEKYSKNIVTKSYRLNSIINSLREKYSLKESSETATYDYSN